MTKIIENFPNYTISDNGAVMNIKTNTEKACTVYKVGYRYCDLSHKGKITKIAIHRLVALAFIPNPENKRVVNHIDGNKLNNTLTNLEWCTDAENIQHGYDTGLTVQPSKFSEDKYREFYNKVKQGKTLTEIAKTENSAVATISENLKSYTILWGVNNAYNLLLKSQKKLRAKNTKQVTQPVGMFDKLTGELLHIFMSISDGAKFLNSKNSGNISNVLKGRSKTAMGFKWKTVNLNDYPEREYTQVSGNV